jgi:hypothetical protein
MQFLIFGTTDVLGAVLCTGGYLVALLVLTYKMLKYVPPVVTTYHVHGYKYSLGIK